MKRSAIRGQQEMMNEDKDRDRRRGLLTTFALEPMARSLHKMSLLDKLTGAKN